LKDKRELIKVLEGWTNKKWKLQYRGSRDGFYAKHFHSLCDHKGEALYIAEDVNGYIFGGYTSVGWRSLNIPINDPNAFIFTLKNPHHIPPTQFHFTNHGEAFRDEAQLLLKFGANPYDINTNERPDSLDSTFNFPVSYFDTTGKGKALFTGNVIWRAKEIEVLIVKS
jgi:hypothetical protein